MGRIGILGGTFNPVHLGHLFMANEVAWRLALDRVLMIPCCQPPHKPGADVAPAADRLAMVRAAVAGNPRLDASDLEIRRGGVSYTIDTLAELARADAAAERFLIVGADSIAELPSWHRAAEIASLAQWVLVARPGYDFGAVKLLAPILPAGGVERLRRFCLEVPALDVSATDLRRRLRAGEPIRYLVPDAVATYIETRRLFAAPPRR